MSENVLHQISSLIEKSTELLWQSHQFYFDTIMRKATNPNFAGYFKNNKHYIVKAIKEGYKFAKNPKSYILNQEDMEYGHGNSVFSYIKDMEDILKSFDRLGAHDRDFIYAVKEQLEYIQKYFGDKIFLSLNEKEWAEAALLGAKDNLNQAEYIYETLVDDSGKEKSQKSISGHYADEWEDAMFETIKKEILKELLR